MSNIRDRKTYVDSAKGLGMITMLFARTCGFPNDVIGILACVYYMPMFFILSGYTYVPKGTNLQCITKRCRRLLKPYFGFSVLILFLWATKAAVLGDFELNKVLVGVFTILWSRGGILKNGVDPFALHIGDQGPLWFFTAITLTTIVFILLQEKWPRKRMFQIAICGAMILVTYLMNLIPVFLPWCVDSVLLGASFHLVGYEFAKNHVFDNIKSKNSILNVLLCAVVYCGLCFLNRSVNYSISLFGSRGLISICIFWGQGITGSYVVIWICRLLQHTKVDAILSLIGRHTVIIFSLHLVMFKLVSTVMETYFGAAATKHGIIRVTDILKIAVVIFGLVLLDVLLKKKKERN